MANKSTINVMQSHASKFSSEPKFWITSLSISSTLTWRVTKIPSLFVCHNKRHSMAMVCNFSKDAKCVALRADNFEEI